MEEEKRMKAFLQTLETEEIRHLLEEGTSGDKAGLLLEILAERGKDGQ